MDLTKLEIVTPRGIIFDKDVKTVTLPGAEGEFGVLAQHAALVSMLSHGVIDIEHNDGKREMVAIDWGYVKVDENKISILANGAKSISPDGDISKTLADVDKLFLDITDDNATLAATRARIEKITRG